MSDQLSPWQFGFSQHYPAMGDNTPFTSRSTFGPRETETVDPSAVRFHTEQDWIHPDTVEKYRANPLRRVMAGPPTAVRHEGQLWVDDGHHRIAAALQRGKPFKVGIREHLGGER